jgi:hypothetical protein
LKTEKHEGFTDNDTNITTKPTDFVQKEIQTMLGVSPQYSRNFCTHIFLGSKRKSLPYMNMRLLQQEFDVLTILSTLHWRAFVKDHKKIVICVQCSLYINTKV